MSLPPRFRSDLWRRIAEAQDASLRDACLPGGPPPLQQVGRDVARVIAGRLVAQGRDVGRGRLRLRTITLGMGAAAVAVAAVALVVAPRVWHRQVMAPALSLSGVPAMSETSGPDARRGDEERAFVADARSDLPLQFSDGSTVTFRAGSAGRMQRLTGAGAEIALERGWLDVHVVHAESTLWLFHAGPYRVRVTGTRFAVTWAAPNFQVDLFEGAVVVDGALLGAGVPLRAGHRLKIAAGTVLVEPLAPATTVGVANPAVAAPSDTPAAMPNGLFPDNPVDRPAVERLSESAPARRATNRSSEAAEDRWLVLADRGAYLQALAAAKRLGWSDLCHRLDARRLLTLGDVARYSGAHAKARQAFTALVTRFPDDRLAADAVFSLGRMAFESRRPGEATRWFGRYVADWPHAALADQAAGRLLECAIRVEDHQAARTAAERYLVRAPHGPHATLAREVLDQPVDGPQ